ncbi:MAG: DUF2877 domain-containing protein [Nocardioides sp.]
MPRVRGPLAASCPPRVLGWLGDAEPGPLRVLHRGETAVYAELLVGRERRCVGVVASTAVAVPCALRLAAPTLPGGWVAEVDLVGGRLRLDGRPVEIGRLVDPTVPALPGAAPAAGPVHPPSAELAAFPDPVDAAAVTALVGSGSGLTPLGDDLLCGWLGWHRAAGVATPDLDAAVRAALGRTTLLSATLLECALAGGVVPEFAAWLRAVGAPDDEAATTALRRLGHTSGTGLWYGAQRARRALTLRRTHPPSRQRVLA